MKIKNSDRHERKVNSCLSQIFPVILYWIGSSSKKKKELFSQENAILLTVLIVMFSAAEYNRFHIYMAG